MFDVDVDVDVDIDTDIDVVVWSRRYGTQCRTFYCRCLTSLRFWLVLVPS